MLIPIIVFALFVGATTLMPQECYSSPWWFALWAIVGLALTVGILRSRLWRRPILFTMHLALLLVLAGGGVTALTATRGEMHLLPGATANTFISSDGQTITLPFKLHLCGFHTDYYPGMSFPRDFHSELDAIAADGSVSHISISMNHIGRLDGYRLYQQSFDGKGGTILGVNHDPAGIAITYAGYILYAVAGLLWLLSPIFRPRQSHLRCKGMKWGKGVGVAFLAMLLPAGASASVPVIPEEQARQLAQEQVIFQGQTVPYNTLCRQLTHKLTGSYHVGRADAVQFISSLTLYQEEWLRTPFLKVKGEELQTALGLHGSYIAPSALYTSDGTYRLAALQGRDKTLDSQILQLDEKTALLGQLLKGELFTPLKATPNLKGIRPLSPLQLRVHLLYENLMPWKWWFMFTLLCALLLFLLRIFKREDCKSLLSITLTAIPAAAAIIFFIAEWIVMDRIPLASSSEIMLFMAVIASLLALTLCLSSRKGSHSRALLPAMALLMAGGLGMVGWLGMKEGMMSPLMPVLASPWLAAHVSIIMVSYVLLAMTFPAAILLLIENAKGRQSIVETTDFIYAMLRPGVYLMGVGIFLGAMWANVSWGRYWAWDPKETWALVAWIIYALPLHPRLFSIGLPSLIKRRNSSQTDLSNLSDPKTSSTPTITPDQKHTPDQTHMPDQTHTSNEVIIGEIRQKRTRLLAIYLLFAILSLLMTYIGVNWLPSLHSYA